ncbi:helix-turn-helix domain-containing protein [Chryseobacterium gallinarum]|uniref:helix-turn-helix domain-containing protein n=1 Tax=Chryseobacterium gallinarum TaxID=1324352 RepID=UPI00202438E8|nr:helix-turn-helix domain-containing protein [Chryseobacterium gallinarum]MCL8538634.1 helix-turn-helix domain-containing protein [Chryseobacterium gallinarum]
MKNTKEPDYIRIYSDLIRKKLPHKEETCRQILSKPKLDSLDVINLNTMLFGSHTENQKYRAYDEKAIKEILIYQKKYKLTNSQLGKTFSISRNTITKWKRLSKAI